MEIGDYEKTVKSLNLQVIAKEKEIGDLKQEMNELNSSMAKSKADYEALEREREVHQA